MRRKPPIIPWGGPGSLGLCLGWLLLPGPHQGSHPVAHASEDCRTRAAPSSTLDLIVLPTPARQLPSGDWSIPILGQVVSQLPDASLRRRAGGKALEMLARKLLQTSAQATLTPRESELLRAVRSRRLWADPLCKQSVTVLVYGKPVALAADASEAMCGAMILSPEGSARVPTLPSNQAGIFCGVVQVPDRDLSSADRQRGVLELAVQLSSGPSQAQVPSVKTYSLLVQDSPRAVLLISDIDDTVRISHVPDRRALLRGALMQPFVAAPGMSALYRRWAEHTPGLSLHFVSSSPFQLAESLQQELLSPNAFPPATLHLKALRKSEPATLLNLLASPLATKPLQIAPLLARYPHNPVVFVGDSGELDPEVYAQVATADASTRDRLLRIYVRDVLCDEKTGDLLPHTGDSPWVKARGTQPIAQGTCRQARFAAAFARLPVLDKWCIFGGGEDLHDVTPPGETPGGPRPPTCWPATQQAFDQAQHMK